MKLAFVADGRSPTARSWMALFIDRGHEVHLISTFSCDPPEGLTSYAHIPVALSQFTRDPRGGSAPGGASGIPLRATLRHWVGPLTILRSCMRCVSHSRACSQQLPGQPNHWWCRCGGMILHFTRIRLHSWPQVRAMLSIRQMVCTLIAPGMRTWLVNGVIHQRAR